MDSKFTQKYTLALTVMAASMTAAVMMFYVLERSIKTNRTTEQIQILEHRLVQVTERLEQTGFEIQKVNSFGSDMESLRRENIELRERVEFYKEKNEFLLRQVEELKKQ